MKPRAPSFPRFLRKGWDAPTARTIPVVILNAVRDLRLLPGESMRRYFRIAPDTTGAEQERNSLYHALDGRLNSLRACVYGMIGHIPIPPHKQLPQICCRIVCAVI